MPSTTQTTPQEDALYEALYASNRAIDALIKVAPINEDEDCLEDNGWIALTAIRDSIWSLGAATYGWKD